MVPALPVPFMMILEESLPIIEPAVVVTPPAMVRVLFPTFSAPCCRARVPFTTSGADIVSWLPDDARLTVTFFRPMRSVSEPMADTLPEYNRLKLDPSVGNPPRVLKVPPARLIVALLARESAPPAARPSVPAVILTVLLTLVIDVSASDVALLLSWLTLIVPVDVITPPAATVRLFITTEPAPDSVPDVRFRLLEVLVSVPATARDEPALFRLTLPSCVTVTSVGMVI